MSGEVLYWAAEHGDVATVQQQLAWGADVNWRNPHWANQTPLHPAASNGHATAVHALLQAGADVNASNSEGNTPLHLAAMHGHLEAVQVLVQASAHVNATNQLGQTAMQAATINGHYRVMQLLIQATADAATNEVMSHLILSSASADQSFASSISDIFCSSASSFRSESGVLAEHGLCLTEEARKGRLDAVIGRDKEVQQCLEILCRRTKNNPVLVGEPGVGKTAVAEGVAQMMAAGKVPPALKGYELWSIEVSALVTDTKYTGELEKRVRAVLEAVEAAGKVVVFIDEIHQLVGAGRTEGDPTDVAQMLKPALARGKFPCIGATTLKEHSKYIENDPALERRFQKVLVNPPSVPDAIAILQGVRPTLEKHHRVSIAPAAVTASVELSERYVADRFLPDKAIDLLDTASARKSMGAVGTGSRGVNTAGTRDFKPRPPSMAGAMVRQLSRRQALQDADPTCSEGPRSRLHGLRSKVKDVVTSMSDQMAGMSVRSYGGGQGQEQQRALGYGGGGNVVTEADIAQVLAEWTGIPVQRLGGSEAQSLLGLPAQLEQRVKGQPEAVQVVAQAVQRARAGLADPNRPLASFLFLGTTGVGKTELAKALAAFLFHAEDAMVRLDMGEFMEKNNVARLVGAAPGLVGHEDGGQLTDAVRRKPYSVVLLDEIEKAHPDLTNILLGVLDDGRLTDSKGRVVSFKNTIVIMTSNLGASEILASSQAPDPAKQQQHRAEALRQVQQHFRPELLNRIDELVWFRPLGLQQVRDIVRIQASRVSARLADRHMELQLREGAVEWLAGRGFDPANGARPVKRAIQQHLENPLTDALLRGVFTDGDVVIVDAQPGAPFLQLSNGGKCTRQPVGGAMPGPAGYPAAPAAFGSQPQQQAAPAGYPPAPQQQPGPAGCPPAPQQQPAPAGYPAVQPAAPTPQQQPAPAGYPPAPQQLPVPAGHPSVQPTAPAPQQQQPALAGYPGMQPAAPPPQQQPAPAGYPAVQPTAPQTQQPQAAPAGYPAPGAPNPYPHHQPQSYPQPAHHQPAPAGYPAVQPAAPAFSSHPQPYPQPHPQPYPQPHPQPYAPPHLQPYAPGHSQAYPPAVPTSHPHPQPYPHHHQPPPAGYPSVQPAGAAPYPLYTHPSPAPPAPYPGQTYPLYPTYRGPPSK